MPCIDLICSSCGDRATVSFRDLHRQWVTGFENISTKSKKDTKVSTEARCRCGEVEKYNNPMFDYVFQVIFHDFIEEDAI